MYTLGQQLAIDERPKNDIAPVWTRTCVGPLLLGWGTWKHCVFPPLQYSYGSIQKYQQVFGALPQPLSYKTLVQMDLNLQTELEGSVVTRRPYPAPQDQVDKIERQIQDRIDAGLVE